MNRPHYLRVVQALALVSGFGPVTIVAGATYLGCGGALVSAPGDDAASDAPPFTGFDSGTIVTGGGDGSACAPEGCGGNGPGPGPDGGFADGAAAIPDAVFPGALADAADAGTESDTGADVTVDDGSTDASVDGGPLPPPDLPA